MNTRLAIVGLFAAAMLLAADPPPIAPPALDAPEAVQLHLQLINRTPDAPPVGAGVPVVIKQEIDGQEPHVVSGATDERGVFTATMNPRLGIHWAVAVSYRDVQFNRHVVWNAQQGEDVTSKVDVYDPTESADGLRVQKHHVLLQPSGDHLTVREIVVFEQTEPRVFVGPASPVDGQRQSVSLNLPTGYHDLVFNTGGMDCCTSFLPNRATSTMPIMPGKTVIDFEYQLPLHAGGNTGFAKEIIYPTISYMVMLPAGNSRLLSDQLAVNSQTVSDGTMLDTAQTLDLKPGEHIAVRVEQAEQRNPTASAAYHFAPWWIALAGGLILCVWLAFGLRRAPAPTKTPVLEEADVEVLLSFLVDQIAELDSAYLTNQVSRQYYGNVRPRLKAQLQRLLKEAPVPEEVKEPHAAAV